MRDSDDSEVAEMLNRLVAVEARLRELEDEREIRTVLSRYGYYADGQLDNEYFGLFTEDCVMDVSSGHAPDPFELIRWEGLEEMKSFLRERAAEHGTGFLGNSLHVQGNNFAVKVDGDDAVANGYSCILQQDGLEVRLVSASINAWYLRREAGAWKISQRTRRMLGAPDTPQVLRASEA